MTTSQAAARLGVSPIRVRQLIGEGRLPAQKMGRDWLIEEANLRLVADRPPGRPSKAAKGKARRAGGAAKAKGRVAGDRHSTDRRSAGVGTRGVGGLVRPTE
jgi:excisionase family DNA binding protein